MTRRPLRGGQRAWRTRVAPRALVVGALVAAVVVPLGVLAPASSIAAVVPTIETFAGGLGPAHVDLSQPGAGAAMAIAPTAMAAGGDRVYVLDTAHRRTATDTVHQVVRRIDTGANTVDIVAGTGGACVRAGCGDGGLATRASLPGATRLAVDRQDNLYIAGGGSVRKVDSSSGIITGKITTVIPSRVLINGINTAIDPHAVAVATDASGGVGAYYVLARPRGLLRVLPDGTGEWVTPALPGNCSVSAENCPSSLVVDDSGGQVTLYVAGPIKPGQAGIIWRVGPAGQRTTVAGVDSPAQDAVNPSVCGPDSTPAGAAGPIGAVGGMAMVGRSLLFTEIGCHRARRIDFDASGNVTAITTVAGDGTACSTASCGDGAAATKAQLNGPQGVGLANGRLFVADTGDNKVRSVGTGGAMTTVAGNATCCFAGDGGPRASAVMNQPGPLAVDPLTDDVYVADTANNRVRRMVAAGPGAGTIVTVAGGGASPTTCGPAPPDLHPCGDGGPGPAAELKAPGGLVVDGARRFLYIADTANNRVRRLDLESGVITTVAGNGLPGNVGGAIQNDQPATDAPLVAPLSLALDPDGNLYFTTGSSFASGPGGVYRLDRATGTIRLVIKRVGSLAWRGADLYLVDSQVVKVNVTTGVATPVTTGSVFASPRGLAVSGDDLYVADTGHHLVRKVSTDGTITTVAGQPDTKGLDGDGGEAAQAWLSSPGGVAAGRSGRLYVADTDNDRIRRISGLDGLAPPPPDAPPGCGPPSAEGYGTNARFAPGTASATGMWTVTDCLPWTTTPGLPIANQSAATLLADGRVLVVGGVGSAHNGHQYPAVTSTELYDPATGTWRVGAPMAAGRIGPTATLLEDGRVLVAGGCTYYNDYYKNTVPCPKPLSSAEIYDPVAGTWSGLLDMALAPGLGRADHTAVRLDGPMCRQPDRPIWCGKVLLAGGGLSGGAQLFDPDPGHPGFTATNAMVVTPSFATATLLDGGKVLLAGGRPTGPWEAVAQENDLAPYNDPATDKAQIFDPVSKDWSTASAMTMRRTNHAAARLPDGRVLVTGGCCSDWVGGSSNPPKTPSLNLASAELYDPSADTWAPATAAMSEARFTPTATTIDGPACRATPAPKGCGAVLVLGGGTRGADLYADPRFVPTDDAPFVRRSRHTATLLDPPGCHDGGLPAVAPTYPCGAVLVAGGDAAGVVELFRSAGERVPVVLGLSPDQGITAGGTRVVISGSSLRGATRVSFGGVDAPFVRVDSNAQLTVAAPRHATPGQVDVRVTIDSGGAARTSAVVPAARFSFTASAPAAPTVAAVEPRAGPTFGGTAVAIAGQGLENTTSVLFGGQPAAALSFVSSTEVVAVTPPGVQGDVDVSLVAGGGVILAEGRFTYAPGTWARGPDLITSSAAARGASQWQSAAVTLDPPGCHQGASPAVASGYPCGRVLVAGGFGNSKPTGTRATGDSRLYDPASDTWSATSDMTDSHTHGTAVLLGDGRVLVAGSSVEHAEVFDPAANTWVPTGPNVDYSNSYEASVTVLDPPGCRPGGSPAVPAGYPCGQVLMAGGSRGVRPFGDPLANPYPGVSSELFDPHGTPQPRYRPDGGLASTATSVELPRSGATGSWRATQALHHARGGHTATLLDDGRVLVVGGYGPPVGFERLYPALDSAEIYDPAQGTWTETPALNLARMFHTATRLDGPACHQRRPPGWCGDVFVADGTAANSFAARSAFIPIASGEIFDPATSMWRPTTSPRAGRVAHTATLLPNGTVLLVGSGAPRFEDGNSGPVLASAEVFDPAATDAETGTEGAWTETSRLQAARGGHVASLLDGPACREASPPPAYCGSVLVAGGSDGPNPLHQGSPYPVTSTERYTPAPHVTAVAPRTGGRAGGTSLAVVGSGLAGATAASVGGDGVDPATLAVTSPSTATMVVPALDPPHAAGPVEVVMVGPGGTSAHRAGNPSAQYLYTGAPGRVALVARVTGAHEAELSFDAPDDGTTIARATSYLVKQSSAPIADQAGFDAAASLCPGPCPVAADTNVKTVQLSVTGLAAGQAHHFAVRAVGPTGELGPISNDAVVDLAAAAVAAAGCPAIGAAGAGQVAYPGGYSLIGVPGGTRVGAGSPLYGWHDQGSGGAYSTLGPDQAATAGHGYWAWFACPRLVSLPGAGASGVSVRLALGAYHASMVGNPSASAPAAVSGHDFAARWDPSLNGGAGGYEISSYRQAVSLGVGEGRWLFSYGPTEISLSAP